jgi:hypothetical protein
MTKLPPGPPDADVRPGGKTPGPPLPVAAIRDAVITSLGRPPGLYRVVVLPLWQGHYRVNVVTGSDATSVCIPHSYFVEAGDDGAVISSTPPIVRLYP